MYQVTVEIPEETVVNGLSNVMIFKSEMLDTDTAYRVFDEARSTIYALNMENCYVNLLKNGKMVQWYRK